LRLVALV